MAQAAFRQDMPPEGGYKALNFKRVPGQKYFTNRFLFTYFGAMSIISWIGYRAGFHRYRHMKLDNADRDVALTPFMLAERDRAYMKHLRRMHEEEKVVMKDVPNWKIGHHYNLPIYNTLPEDYHLDPSIEELFAHASEADIVWTWAFPMAHFNYFPRGKLL
ncbi:NADH dehydrogenase [ubiquinone] 1 alpha subcomplex subunit 13 [Galendromus occidentalis]|uniref:NADH dehydrogenase [ubiquinone] 1 alpha subcomplex subunit 13 n=1 Tax=Galendromus occidentalis TaxID=34638 RepID=A0AAJ6VVU3_9ACAR|nr:NADH dehydrogenase [ubiquinone] 1 alpha subcomplex subunit 13 [Galendromus occidentalis]